MEDTRTDPAVAAEKLEAMAKSGIKIVIGPYSSAEVRQAKPYADANGVILISPLSTATSGSADDNVLRFTPDDEAEGKAVAALAWADGIKVIIPVTRDDEGKGLQAAMKATFEALGGTFAAGVTDPPTETDFRDEAMTIATALNRSRPPAAAPASISRPLARLRGSSAPLRLRTLCSGRSRGTAAAPVALSKDLVENRTAAEFAITAGYPTQSRPRGRRQGEVGPRERQARGEARAHTHAFRARRL